ncbi:MAG: hypothetical protein IAG13_01595 [Deltaproteobacteria bacterium]|nr:hypothetical protein [Nannocystaceae bacterium]
MIHCWEHTQEIEDATGDDKFDGTCQNFYGGTQFAPNIPPLGTFFGRACVDEQVDHDTVKDAIQHILDDDHESLLAVQIAVYEQLVDDIVEAAWQQCEDYLTCGDDFPNCDLVPGGQQQVCTPGSAAALCDLYVTAAAEDILLELQGGGDAQPNPSSPGSKFLAEDEVCDYVADFGETGGDDGGSDSGGPPADPFGDLDDLVACSPQTSCTLDAQLLWNVQASFNEFYDEGVSLTIGNSGTPCNVTGVIIGGLGTGEDSKKLADKFGFRNADVISKVEGINTNSETNTFAVVHDLETTTDPVTLTIKRRNGSTCTILNYTLTPTGY